MISGILGSKEQPSGLITLYPEFLTRMRIDGTHLGVAQYTVVQHYLRYRPLHCIVTVRKADGNFAKSKTGARCLSYLSAGVRLINRREKWDTS